VPNPDSSRSDLVFVDETAEDVMPHHVDRCSAARRAVMSHPGASPGCSEVETAVGSPRCNAQHRREGPSPDHVSENVLSAPRRKPVGLRFVGRALRFDSRVSSPRSWVKVLCVRATLRAGCGCSRVVFVRTPFPSPRRHSGVGKRFWLPLQGSTADHGPVNGRIRVFKQASRF
jgi:hypothetical protein